LAALKFFLGYVLDRLHTARTSHHSVETMQDLPHRAGENRICYPPSSSHRAQLIRLDERAADAEFAAAYGYDVTDWTGLALLRDIREMRTTCMAAQAAANEPARLDQARLRMDSLRGRRGARLWEGWEAIP
jgi:hypothetical protein